MQDSSSKSISGSTELAPLGKLDVSGAVRRKASRIQRELNHVRRRMRSQRFWALLAVFGCVAIALLAMLRGSVSTGQLNLQAFSILATVVLLFTVGVAWTLSGRMIGTAQRTAAVVEQRFPGLGQRLLTSVELFDRDQSNSLVGRVITETHQHYQGHDWRKVVPTISLWCSRLFGAVAFAGAVVFAMPLRVDPPKANPLAATLDPSDPVPLEVTVLPGDVSLEKGKSLVVTAEFSGGLPETASLVTLGDDGSRRSWSMKRNLSDPILAAVIPRVNQSMRYRVETPTWTGEDYQVDVFEYPELVRSDADLVFPKYTGLEDRLVEDTVKVSVVEGSHVTWKLNLNKAVRSATLVGEDGEHIVCEAIGKSLYVTSMTPKESVSYKLKLIDGEDRENKFPPSLSIKVIPNKPPKLKLATAKDVTVSALQELNLRATATDDYGIQRTGLSYSLEGGELREVELAKEVARNVKAPLQHTVDFEALGAKPDDMLSFYFWAEDVASDGTPRRTESDLFFADVRPFEQIFRASDSPPSSPSQQQNSQAQQAGELAEIQKQIVTAIWNLIRDESLTGTETSEENLETLRTSQFEAISMLSDIQEKLQDSKSIETATRIENSMLETVEHLNDRQLESALGSAKTSLAGLLKLRAREVSVTRRQQQSQQGRASNQNRQKQIDELELDQDENRYQNQQQAAAQSEQEQAAREDRQVLSRLRELAQRAEDLNEELAKLQTALEKAETEEEKEEIERRLKRLREQQQELLRQADDLESRMRSEENSERMSEQADQLQQSRDALAQSSKATEEEDTSAALAAGRRAEQQFDELEQEFRRRTAGAFDETMRDMVEQSQQLQREQEKIGQSMREQVENAAPGLRGDEQTGAAPDQLEKQAERLEELVQSIQETVQEAEESEPLLAERLYEAFRDVERARTAQNLDNAAELMRRGFAPQAEQFEQAASEGIENLNEKVEEAAEAVLGDSAEGLRRAAEQLERLSQGVDNELNENRPPSDSGRGQQESQPAQGDPQRDGRPSEPSDQNPPGQGQPGQGQPQQGQPSDSQQDDQSQGSQRGDGRQDDPASEQEQQQSQGQQPSQGQQQGRQGQQPGQSQQQGQQQSQGQSQQGQGQSQQGQGQSQQGQGQSQRGERPSPGLRGEASGNSGERESQQRNSTPNQRAAERESDGGGPIGPLTGDFRAWSDRMRDVEEMVGDAELRGRAATIRDRVRQMRIEMKRHGDAPQWELVEDLIADPLRELTSEVRAELLRRTAKKNALVPIDRDPVPAEFADAVRKYYENLAGGRLGETNVNDQ